MNKKVILALIVVVGIAGGLIYKFGPISSINKLTGEITEVGENFIVVKGYLRKEGRVVQFIITPNTEFNKSILAVSSEKLAAPGPVAPERRIVKGEKTDLVVGKVLVVYSQDNLLTVSKTEAIKIDYVGGYEFSK